MKNITLLLLVLITGCMTSVAEIESDEVLLEEISNDMSGYESGGPGHWNQCNGPGDVIVLDMPDGSTVTMVMPVLCNSQLTIDTGDPSPEHSQEEVENPYDDEFNNSASNSQF